MVGAVVILAFAFVKLSLLIACDCTSACSSSKFGPPRKTFGFWSVKKEKRDRSNHKTNKKQHNKSLFEL